MPLYPMWYALLFLNGDRGWQKWAIVHDTRKVTLLEHAWYIIARLQKANKIYQVHGENLGKAMVYVGTYGKPTLQRFLITW